MRDNVGLKVYCNPNEQLRMREVKAALPPSNPLEIGFYSMEGPYRVEDGFLDDLVAEFGTHNKKIVHLSMKNALFPYQKPVALWEQEILEEVALAQSIGAEYCIIHDVKWAPGVKKTEEMVDLIVEHARHIADCSPLPLYMENTFSGVEFYRRVFQQTGAALQFVFDIGHAKVWSHDSLESWAMLLSELVDQGVKIHFHIHANDELFDRHRPFTKLSNPESEHFIRHWTQKQPDSNFVLEINEDYAANLALFA